MDRATARILNNLTSDFYRCESAAFSKTRQTPWEGWERALEAMGAQATGTEARLHPLRLIDLGCGNLRFERFLSERLDAFPETWAFDNCPALATTGLNDSAREHVHFQPLDVVDTLLESEPGNETATLTQALGVRRDTVDLAVAFGFMHHLALPEHRLAVLEALAACTRPGGHAVVAFWQFARNPKMRAKAEATTKRGCEAIGLTSSASVSPLDKNDYLLGWQHTEGVWRYCHHFPECEIDELISSLAPRAREVARFSADGKTHDLNRYVVLEVR